MGLAPQKPRLAGVKQGFLCLQTQLCGLYVAAQWWQKYRMVCIPQRGAAVILRDPLLFNFPCRSHSDSASAGRVPAEAQFTTDKGINGRLRVYFLPFSKCLTYAPQNDRSENTTTRLFDFWATGSPFGEMAPF